MTEIEPIPTPPEHLPEPINDPEASELQESTPQKERVSEIEAVAFGQNAMEEIKERISAYEEKIKMLQKQADNIKMFYLRADLAAEEEGKMIVWYIDETGNLQYESVDKPRMGFYKGKHE